jgi:hypothetical protein
VLPNRQCRLVAVLAFASTALAVAAAGSAAGPGPGVPSAPAHVSQTAARATSVTVSWAAATGDVAGYDTYIDGAWLGYQHPTSQTVTGLACGTSYTFEVEAYAETRTETSPLAGVTTTTSACDEQAPASHPTLPAPPESGSPPTGLPTVEAPAPGTADGVFVSPGGSDANACTQAAPCRSFDRAYRAAQPGQVVEIAGGTYDDQLVRADESKTSSAHVVFRPAAGASVVVGSKPPSTTTLTTAGLAVSGAEHLTFEALTIRGDVRASDGAEDVTFENLVSANGLFSVHSPTRDVTFRGGSFGGTNRYQAQVYPSGDGTHNVNFTLDGTTLHDVRSDDLEAYHVECLLLADAIGAVIRNAKLHGCDVFDLSIGVFDDGVLSNVLVENNSFGSTGPTVVSGLGLNTNTTRWDGLNVRNNTSLAAMRHPDCSEGCTDVVYSGNISPLYGPWACVAGVSYRHNVWTDSVDTCGTSDLGAPAVAFVDPSGTPPDLHLSVDSIASGRGDPANVPATDMDGDPRPVGTAPDAGADEV